MNIFFPSTITEWNKHSLSIRNSTSFGKPKGKLLQFLKLQKTVYIPVTIPEELSTLQKLKLGFSHLCYHKFKHGFLHATDPLCSCRTAIEKTVYYFFHCPNFSTVSNTFLNEIPVDRSIIGQEEIKIIQTFLYGNSFYSANDSKLILKCEYKAYFGN